MGNRLEIVTKLHKRTERDYIGRMKDEKVLCMDKAKEYSQDYWDGDRRFGYGGYRYDGRWSVVAKALIDQYGLKKDAKILDAGCGKGFLLHELKLLLPDADIRGFDISEYAIDNSKEEIKGSLFVQRVEDPFPFEDGEFDLVISITTLHNIYINQLKSALTEMERVAKNKFLVVESYRNSRELFNLQCWALTCEAFFTPKEWEWLFSEFNYTGDYEFIYFE